MAQTAMTPEQLEKGGPKLLETKLGTFEVIGPVAVEETTQEEPTTMIEVQSGYARVAGVMEFAGHVRLRASQLCKRRWHDAR